MSMLADPPPPVVREPKGLQYVTGDKLGNGGFAICYRAELCQDARPTGKIVALKIVKSHMDKRVVQKFVTELQLHSKLHHPNIVEFYRAFSFDQNTYVVLELCHNGSLADALRKRKFFTMPEIRRFIIQTCGAIKYLHHRNIVHRDLKTGNIFLDKGMNVKVGDFGLAAVLVSKHDIGMRRTTMCGTPNYLAPEILEKTGHNEKVDLWAVGIISYTLAVGKAPFHASNKEEIYKKARKGEYEWPDVSKHQNDISNDLRDLVSSLLVHEDERPGPDRIVSHAFFKTKFIPETLDSSCTTKRPTWPGNRPPSPDTIRRGYSESWYRLCKTSGVGEYAPGKAFPMNGAKRIVSVVKDCEKEIAAGRAPVVPIPNDTVYLPFPERINILESRVNQLSEIAEERESSAEGRQLAEINANDRSNKVASRAVDNARTRRLKENIEPQAAVAAAEPQQETGTVRRNNSARKKEEAKPSSSRQTSREQIPVPTARATSSRQASREQPVEEKPMLLRQASRRERPIRTVAAVRSREASKESQPSSAAVITKPSPPPVAEATVRRAPTVRAVSSKRIPVRQKTAPAEVISIPDDTPSSSEAEELSKTSFTDPAVVLARAAQLRDNIMSALSGESLPRSTGARKLPFVSKWVEYAKKHGVGYALEDGSIGCLFKATSKHPVTYAVVRNGYSHLEEVGRDRDAVDRVPIEYWTHHADDELKSTAVEGDRKRRTSIIWAKFGQYMWQQLGELQKQSQSGRGAVENTLFVRYYQRMGFVGIWGFSDGCFQFNFPDHTKIVLSADGRQCNFTCLSVEAIAHLREHGVLQKKYIWGREVLSGTLESLLYGKGNDVKSVLVTEANLLHDKLKFIADVVGQWTAAGGLGCGPDGDVQRIEWDGPQLEDERKEGWFTVGRFGGDTIRV